MIKESNFTQWTKQKLEHAFGIQRVSENNELTNWLNGTVEITKSEKETLMTLAKRSAPYLEDWNEIELITKFIAPVTNLVDFDTDKFKLFAGRKISATLNGTKLNGIVDAIVATGTQDPEKPFFCLHEYKRSARAIADPAGQLLSEMLAIQTLNNDNQPVYGVYVLASNWFFVVLDKKKYAISPFYNALSEQILDIFKSLKYLKVIIEKRVGK